MTTASSTGEITFGYFPDHERIDVALSRGRFERALVLDMPVRSLVEQVRECRVLWQPEVELPEGVYWFQGVDDGAIILQVAVGAVPGGAMVESPYDLHPDHPLLAAWGWAEELWHKAATVPPPRFAINEAVLAHHRGLDVVVRDRKFLRGHWSYTVVVEGRQQDVVESRLRPRPQIDDPATWVTQAPTPANRFSATLTAPSFWASSPTRSTHFAPRGRRSGPTSSSPCSSCCRPARRGCSSPTRSASARPSRRA